MRFAIMAGIATINKPIWFEISEQSSHLDFKGDLNAPFKLSPPIILHSYYNINMDYAWRGTETIGTTLNGRNGSGANWYSPIKPTTRLAEFGERLEIETTAG